MRYRGRRTLSAVRPNAAILGPDGRPLVRGRDGGGGEVGGDRRGGGGSGGGGGATDVFGRAFRDHHLGGEAKERRSILYDVVTLEYHDAEETPVEYFFRSVDEMPDIERQALDLCRGRVLDVGCGAGSHALELQKRGLDVTGIDLSPGAVDVARRRGLKQALCGNFLDFKPGVDKRPEVFWNAGTHAKYDTILLMMNGIGIAGTAEGLDRVLQRAKNLLSPDGQILLDSTDLSYMYTSEDGSKFEFDFDPKEHYYGETLISVQYGGQEETFNWLFIDFDSLAVAARRNGFEAIFVGDELMPEEERGLQYLAKLVPREDNPLLDELRGAQIVDEDMLLKKNSPIVGEE